MAMDGGRPTDLEVHVLACAACPRVSSFGATRWRAYLVEDDDEEPTVEFLCPACAAELA